MKSPAEGWIVTRFWRRDQVRADQDRDERRHDEVIIAIRPGPPFDGRPGPGRVVAADLAGLVAGLLVPDAHRWPSQPGSRGRRVAGPGEGQADDHQGEPQRQARVERILDRDARDGPPRVAHLASGRIRQATSIRGPSRRRIRPVRGSWRPILPARGSAAGRSYRPTAGIAMAGPSPRHPSIRIGSPRHVRSGAGTELLVRQADGARSSTSRLEADPGVAGDGQVEVAPPARAGRSRPGRAGRPPPGPPPGREPGRGPVRSPPRLEVARPIPTASRATSRRAGSGSCTPPPRNGPAGATPAPGARGRARRPPASGPSGRDPSRTRPLGRNSRPGPERPGHRQGQLDRVPDRGVDHPEVPDRVPVPRRIGELRALAAILLPARRPRGASAGARPGSGP